MELSTIIPNTTINPANVTVLSSIPEANRMPSEIKIVMGMVEDATKATRNGSKATTTRITVRMAISNSLRKVDTDNSTTLG
ncbi:hypothetical protein SDC9_27123 [bioreactor metagenome]|uniref:Uncharacterized protein n=1 Tax=bioreactor metagenome TaxID=1076179 RepID=A0A644UQF6_9ZZZZ